MTPATVAFIRSALELTQSELAALLGCHFLTVSKWERGALTPHAYECAMLDAFRLAVGRRPGIGKVATHIMASQGVPPAVYALLDAAYGPLEARRK